MLSNMRTGCIRKGRRASFAQLVIVGSPYPEVCQQQVDDRNDRYSRQVMVYLVGGMA